MDLLNSCLVKQNVDLSNYSNHTPASKLNLKIKKHAVLREIIFSKSKELCTKEFSYFKEKEN